MSSRICARCGKYAYGRLLAVENQEVCVKCCEKDLPTCTKCETLIKGSYVHVPLSGASLHRHCFRCRVCLKEITQRHYLESSDGSFVCGTCFEKSESRACAFCQKPIVGKTLKLAEKKSQNDVFFHPDCFRCRECGDKIRKKYSELAANQFYCLLCKQKILDSKNEVKRRLQTCQRCGHVVDFLLDVNGVGMCKPCAGRHMPPCFHCDEPILSEGLEVSFPSQETETFHSKCFLCSICAVELKGKSYYFEEDNSTFHSTFRFVCGDCKRVKDKKPQLLGVSMESLCQVSKENSKQEKSRISKVKKRNSKLPTGRILSTKTSNSNLHRKHVSKEDVISDKICGACENSIIEGKTFSLKGNFFHDRCFKCFQCETYLHGHKFRHRNGIFVCQSCHKNNH